MFVTFNFAEDAFTGTGIKKNNQVAVLSWIIETYSTVVTDAKGQNRSGNDSGHILSNVSVM